MEISRAFPKKTLSGIGGVETGDDAAQFILLGASTVQVCTGVMLYGYKMVKDMKAQLAAFMEKHKFSKVEQFKGHSLQYFTTHADLVARQKAAKVKKSLEKDTDWKGDQFVDQADALTRAKVKA
jgi:dihydropyrimidine dehydrogenase (NADP+)/dihydropyrimidine dehydrogenase (NAD+) subunit PreA